MFLHRLTGGCHVKKKKKNAVLVLFFCIRMQFNGHTGKRKLLLTMALGLGHTAGVVVTATAVGLLALTGVVHSSAYFYLGVHLCMRASSLHVHVVVPLDTHIGELMRVTLLDCRV